MFRGKILKSLILVTDQQNVVTSARKKYLPSLKKTEQQQQQKNTSLFHLVYELLWFTTFSFNFSSHTPV